MQLSNLIMSAACFTADINSSRVIVFIHFVIVFIQLYLYKYFYKINLVILPNL